jgi:hypothetical protein
VAILNGNGLTARYVADRAGPEPTCRDVRLESVIRS